MPSTTNARRWMLATTVAVSLCGTQLALAQPAPTAPADAPTTVPAAKERFIPAKLWNVPDGNDFASNDSEFSNHRSVETPNFVLFWSKEYGDDPMANPDAGKRFDPQFSLKECERFYDFYVNDLKFVVKGSSQTDKYKVLMFVIGGKGGTAFGGGESKKVGCLWTPAVRIAKPPYGALAHELGHSFQYLTHADGAWAFTSAAKGSRGQSIFEMTSQYMLWQVYPEWITFENYHLVGFLKQTHLAFLHEANQYHSPFVLEYWSGKHGVDFIGKLWRQAQRGEDAVLAYQRLTSINQSQFNDEMFDAARRFVTWDLPRVEKVSARYANQHTSTLRPVGDGWLQIAPERCPQNYGYNAIPLKVPTAGATVTVNFKGAIGAEGFRSVNPERAGWRYGFLAVRDDGSRVYGDVSAKAEGDVEFAVPERTTHLWLVVLGAPSEHWEHVSDGKDETDEQWPYQIRVTGTSVDESAVR